MNGYNKVTLVGNLTRDPELRYTQKGTAVAGISLAVNRKWRDDAGKENEETTFIDIEAWGKQAETLAQYLKKGGRLLVEGRLKLNQWEKDGEKQSRIVVVLESMVFLDSKGRENAPQGQQRASAAQGRAK